MSIVETKLVVGQSSNLDQSSSILARTKMAGHLKVPPLKWNSFVSSKLVPSACGESSKRNPSTLLFRLWNLERFADVHALTFAPLLSQDVARKNLGTLSNVSWIFISCRHTYPAMSKVVERMNDSRFSRNVPRKRNTKRNGRQTPGIREVWNARNHCFARSHKFREYCRSDRELEA